MSLKLFIFLTTCAFLVYGNDVERKDNVESYITKEAAKELNKLSARGKQQDFAYDEMLEQFLSVQQSGDDDGDEKMLFEKKYFDYLPNDLDSEDVTDEDATHELTKTGDVMSAGKLGNVRRVNSRKFKRDLTAQNRLKRQSIYYVPVPLIHYSPYPNVDFYYPQEIQAYPSANSFQSRRFNSNPWHPDNNPGKLYKPNNAYLPPSKPGVNNPQPPHNPAAMPDAGVVDDRVGIFDEDDSDQRVWGSFDRRPNSISPQRPSPTQRPEQTTRRPFQETNDIADPNQAVEVDIELPPDIFDENVKLTTRAPLTRPTASANKSPTRNRNRQTKPATTTPRSTIVRTTTRRQQPDRSTPNVRKQNATLPACVLAIVNCCSRYDEMVRTPCFERFNCNAAFFGQKACSSDIKASAFREVEKFSKK